MTLPPIGFPAAGTEELLGEDWFGAGSVFDTGEDLATALLGLANGEVSWPVPVLTLPAGAPASPAPPEPPAGGAAIGPAAMAPPSPEHAHEFQVATMPSARETPSGWAGRSPAPVDRRRWPREGLPHQSTGWSIRQSVQTIRVTEDILSRLREEAAQITWHYAAATHRETDP